MLFQPNKFRRRLNKAAKWIDGNTFVTVSADRVTGIKLSACGCWLFFIAVLGGLDIVALLACEPSMENKTTLFVLTVPVIVALAIGLGRDGYVAAKYWSEWAKPWWGWWAAMVVRRDEVNQWWLARKARQAHLCESKERCLRLVDRDTAAELVGNHFVEALMRMDGAR